ncbi:metal-dependent hydrolase [Elusimicrobiota bacterium]
MSDKIKITWLGHAAFHVISPNGKSMLIDPWLDNPKCPQDKKNLNELDLILLTHGHFDHMGSAVELAKKFSAKVVCIHEISVWLASRGVKTAMGMNKGGAVEADGIKVTMVNAFHSSSIQDGDQMVYAGEAAGFVIRLENGFKIYHAGDTNVFGDMRLIGEIYKPDLAMLPIGGLYTMDPVEAAKAISLLGVKQVMPMHYGTFPPLTGTPDQLRENAKAIPDLKIHAIKPGEELIL